MPPTAKHPVVIEKPFRAVVEPVFDTEKRVVVAVAVLLAIANSTVDEAPLFA